jgi:hypothetical protein
MIKFEPYPIYINYSKHWQLKLKSEIAEANRAKKYDEEKQLTIKAVTSSDLTLANGLWKDDVKQYETTISRLLRQIESNALGKVLLKILNLKTKIWIVPMPDQEFKGCYCAQTYPLNYQTKPFEGYAIGSGDAYIYYNPDNVFTDDILFHELVHAYRYSFKKFDRMPIDNEYNGEEFLAHHLQNIYLSLLKKELFFAYKGEEKADKARIYRHLNETPAQLKAIEYFSTHEYLAMLAANSLAANVADYNPFRDYRQIRGLSGKTP